MDNQKLQQVTAELQEKYPEVGIKYVEVDESTGKSTFYLEPTKKTLAYVDTPGTEVIQR